MRLIHAVYSTGGDTLELIVDIPSARLLLLGLQSLHTMMMMDPPDDYDELDLKSIGKSIQRLLPKDMGEAFESGWDIVNKE